MSRSRHFRDLTICHIIFMDKIENQYKWEKWKMHNSKVVLEFDQLHPQKTNRNKNNKCNCTLFSTGGYMHD